MNRSNFLCGVFAPFELLSKKRLCAMKNFQAKAQAAVIELFCRDKMQFS
jgi:hypothetical protein